MGVKIDGEVKLRLDRQSAKIAAMVWFALGVLGIGGAMLVYRTVRPMTRRRKKYDAGAVSQDWIEQQRGRSQDASH